MPSRTRSCRRAAARARPATDASSRRPQHVRRRPTRPRSNTSSPARRCQRALMRSRSSSSRRVAVMCSASAPPTASARLLRRQPEVRDERAVVEPRRDRHARRRPSPSVQRRRRRIAWCVRSVARVPSVARRRHGHAVGELERPPVAHVNVVVEDVRPVDVAPRRSSVTPSGETSNDPPRSRVEDRRRTSTASRSAGSTPSRPIRRARRARPSGSRRSARGRRSGRGAVIARRVPPGARFDQPRHRRRDDVSSGARHA